MTMTEKCRALVDLLQSVLPASALRRRPPDNESEDAPPGGRAPFPMELMLTRIQGCTHLLAQDPLQEAPTPIDLAIEQVLLADLGLVTGYLRCQTNDLSTRLNEARADLQGILSEFTLGLQSPLTKHSEPASIKDGGGAVPHGAEHSGADRAKDAGDDTGTRQD